MPNGFPVLRVYKGEIEDGNGILYALWRKTQRGTEYIPINTFLMEAQAEDGFSKFYSDFRSLQTYKDPALNGVREFRTDLRHEFCEKGYALPPEDGYEDENGKFYPRPRAYMMIWNPHTIILLDGVVKNHSGRWQDIPYVQKVVSPLIDIYYAIVDGLQEGDFYQIRGRAGFYDENLNLKSEIELRRYVEHGERLSCDRDLAGR